MFEIRKPKVEREDVTATALALSNFDSRLSPYVEARVNQFLIEVGEQPAALRDLIAFYRGDGVQSLAHWAELA